MGETVEDAIGPAADTDSGTGTTTWHLWDHNEQGYGYQKSPVFNAAKCKDIRIAAKNADQSAFNAACIAAAGATWWNARSQAYRNAAYTNAVRDAAAFP